MCVSLTLDMGESSLNFVTAAILAFLFAHTLPTLDAADQLPV